MSDSHGHDANVRNVIDLNPDADYFLHCGDLCSDEDQFPEVIFVRGNNDWYSDFPHHRIINFEQVRIYMIHSERYWGMGRIKSLSKLARENGCQLCFYGHTHTQEDDFYEGVRLMNPGSLFYNRDGTDIGYIVLTIHGSQYEVERKTL